MSRGGWGRRGRLRCCMKFGLAWRPPNPGGHASGDPGTGSLLPQLARPPCHQKYPPAAQPPCHPQAPGPRGTQVARRLGTVSPKSGHPMVTRGLKPQQPFGGTRNMVTPQSHMGLNADPCHGLCPSPTHPSRPRFRGPWAGLWGRGGGASGGGGHGALLVSRPGLELPSVGLVGVLGPSSAMLTAAVCRLGFADAASGGTPPLPHRTPSCGCGGRRPPTGQAPETV